MKLVLFIEHLRIGGAQRQFAILAEGLARRGHAVTVATLFPGDPCRHRLAACRDIGLTSLYPARGATMARRIAQLADAPRRLRCVLREAGAEVVYSALHTSNLLAWLAVAARHRPALAWSIRSSHREKMAWKQRPSFELCRIASRGVPLIVANSRAGLADCRRQGFRPRSASVVPNGVDVAAFRPDPEAGRRLRAAWLVPEDAPLVGMVARLDPVKDHPGFLRAAALVAARVPSAMFACVGDGPPAYRAELERQARALGLAGRLIWAGERHDMPAVHNAFDLLCLSSRTEGFPNVIAEAMASARPCVATQVGDVAEIVGDAGRTAPPGAPEALAQALLDVLGLSPPERRQLGLRARSRAAEHYSLDAMVSRTEEALSRLVGGKPALAGGPPTRLIGIGRSSW
jgi:glycosyltransferase involved in cell wall biosynthesis